jgi:hypothetical protein
MTVTEEITSELGRAVRVAVTTTGSSSTGSAKAGEALHATSNATIANFNPFICSLLEVNSTVAGLSK